MISSLRLRAALLVATIALALTPGLALGADRTSPAAPAATGAGPATGYDISWPQCGAAYPADPAFGIVGVNAGIVFSPNPCLASEIAWAGGSAAELYANTGNPGPALSKHWPAGQSTPRWCDPALPDSVDCAFDYGFNAAADSFATAQSAFGSLGLAASPSDSAWWLDVETMNSWRSDVALNVAALQGAIASLQSAGVRTIGIYSTQYQWNVITGGSLAFGAHRSWIAGIGDAQAATAKCAGSGFSGGGVALVQFASGSFDGDLRCDAAPVVTSVTVSPATASIPTGATQRFVATATDQFGEPLSPQPSFGWAVSGGGSIDQSGAFTAGSAAGGPFTVTAASGGVTGSASVSVTGAPATDFAISIGPASRTVSRGGSTTYTVAITPVNGFASSVALSVNGLPSGATATFAPNPASPTSPSTLTVRTARNVARGTFTLTVTGIGGGRTHNATVGLTVRK